MGLAVTFGDEGFKIAFHGHCCFQITKALIWMCIKQCVGGLRTALLLHVLLSLLLCFYHPHFCMWVAQSWTLLCYTYFISFISLFALLLCPYYVISRCGLQTLKIQDKQGWCTNKCYPLSLVITVPTRTLRHYKKKIYFRDRLMMYQENTK